jgi:hypothetical protein
MDDSNIGDYWQLTMIVIVCVIEDIDGMPVWKWYDIIPDNDGEDQWQWRRWLYTITVIEKLLILAAQPGWWYAWKHWLLMMMTVMTSGGGGSSEN